MKIRYVCSPGYSALLKNGLTIIMLCSSTDQLLIELMLFRHQEESNTTPILHAVIEKIKSSISVFIFSFSVFLLNVCLSVYLSPTCPALEEDAALLKNGLLLCYVYSCFSALHSPSWGNKIRIDGIMLSAVVWLLKWVATIKN